MRAYRGRSAVTLWLQFLQLAIFHSSSPNRAPFQYLQAKDLEDRKLPGTLVPSQKSHERGASGLSATGTIWNIRKLFPTKAAFKYRLVGLIGLLLTADIRCSLDPAHLVADDCQRYRLPFSQPIQVYASELAGQHPQASRDIGRMQPPARNQVVPAQGEKQKVGAEIKSGECTEEVVA